MIMIPPPTPIQKIKKIGQKKENRDGLTKPRNIHKMDTDMSLKLIRRMFQQARKWKISKRAD